MGVFNTARQYRLPQDKIPLIARDVMEAMRALGYEVEGKVLIGGAWDLSITKGGMFKSVLGLKTALKVSLAPRGPNLMLAEASVGIFGQQAVPTVVMLFVAWPVILTQLWGLVQQARLDDTVMNLVAEAIRHHCPEACAAADAVAFKCPKCGNASMPGAKFCTECGEAIIKG